MVVPVALLLLGALVAVAGPRLLARAGWTEREPVVALWAWQCVVAAVLLCCVLSMVLSAAAAWHAVRGPVFAPAPPRVVEAYALGAPHPWAAVTAVVLACGGLWTAAMLVREVTAARARRRQRRAQLLARVPVLPGEQDDGAADAGAATYAGGAPDTAGRRLVVLEDERPGAWWLPGSPPRFVVTTAALRRLKGRGLDAAYAHEQGHAQARHDWLLYCSAALAEGFPQVPVFAAFRREMHRLVELAADDVASRRFGRLTTALALVELNEDRGVFGPGARARRAQLPQRVDRLLAAPHRLTAARRLRLTAGLALVPAAPLLVTFVPVLYAVR